MREKIKPLTEHQESCLLADYLRTKNIKFAHVANERKANIRQMMYLKAEGLSPGFPDYIIFIPGGVLFIEMKRKKGIVNKNQTGWCDFLNKHPHCAAHICYGFEAAKTTVDYYLKS
jgi:hypothetical protein